MRRSYEGHRRPSPRRPTASVREAAVLVRHFMSATMTIPPTISLRVSPIAPPIGGRRSDLRPRSVAACIPQHWRALPARANPDLLPIAHQNDHARLAWLQPDAPGTPKLPDTKPIAAPARTSSRLRSIRLTWGRLGQADWIQRRICKTPTVVPHPRSEPASVIWSFPHQIKLTFGRRVMRPHHNPACGGQGSRGRDHS